MLFQSLDFAVFLPIALGVYWLLRRHLCAQNLFIVVASCVFYAWWDWRFLVPMAVASGVAYVVAIAIDRDADERHRRLVVATGIVINLGLLAYFKYFNFFADSLNQVFSLFGAPLRLGALRILLPVGISFYIFRTISYMVDVYRGQTEAQRSIVDVVAFVAFFPYLLAGPVERSKTFVPQLHAQRSVSASEFHDALRLILWGLFKKIVIADRLAPYVDYVFVNYHDLTGSALIIGIVYYSVQLYADFSGYSDIAVGVAQLFGFRITQNFALPFFAANIAEFWRRWHISLYNWLNDYLYAPLSIGLRDWDTIGTAMALLLTFALSGLWHGPRWTFLIWGALHGAYMVAYMLWSRRPGGKRRRARLVGSGASGAVTAHQVAMMIVTFGCIAFANLFFRSETLADALSYLRQACSASLFSPPNLDLGKLGWVLVLPVFEWVQRKRAFPLDISSWSYTVQYPVYASLCLAIFVSIQLTDTKAFLYFKF